MNLVRVYAVVLRHYFLSVHQLDRLFTVFFYPTISLVLWGFISRYVQQIQSSHLAALLLGGLLLWIVFENVDTDIGISFMWDVWEGNVVNSFSSPITLFEYMFGTIFVGFLKILVTIITLGIIASVFYNFNITALGFGLALFWVNLILFGWAFGIFKLSLILLFGSRLGPLTWSLPLMLLPFSAVYYPVKILPVVAQKIAWFVPLSHVFEGMRYTLTSGKFDFGQFYTAMGFNLIYLILSIFLLVKIFRVVRRNGQLVKLR